MQHPDEGTIHSWLDGALSADETARLEAHVKECPQCAAAVAEARGFIAGASRILTALDNAPRGVVPVAAPKKRVDPLVWRVAATILVVAAGTLVVVRNRGSNEQIADRVTLSQGRASVAAPVPTAAGPAAGVVDQAMPKAVAGSAPTIALSKKTGASDSRSGVPPRDNSALKQRAIMPAGQAAAASEIAGAAATTASTFAPSHVAGVVATDSASEPEPLKLIGTPRRIGAKVTLYEVAPGDTVTLTESMPLALGQVVVTGTSSASIARQATVKSVAAPSRARADAAAITSAVDSQRAAGAPASAPAVAAPAPKSLLAMANTLHTITWTDSATGNTLTLTGRMPEARLQEIKIRIDRERAVTAAKKKP
jgi:Putative zinc-finger